MRRAKKLLSLALAAAMFVSTFSSTAFASDMDDAYEVDRVDGKYAVVRVEDDGEYYDSKSSITIPSKIKSRTITRIGTAILPFLQAAVRKRMFICRIRLTLSQTALLRILPSNVFRWKKVL